MSSQLRIDSTHEVSDVWRKCPSRTYSSTSLDWEGIVVEHHIAQPGEKPLTTTQHYIVELAAGREQTYGERPNRKGTFLPYVRHPGTMNIYAEGVLPTVFVSTRTELIVCALKPDFVAEIAEEQEGLSKAELREVIGLRDRGTVGLIRLLDEEAKTGGPLGKLYAEYLVHAFTQRLLFKDNTKENSLPTTAGRWPRLQRVLDLMHANLSVDLDLHSLAKASGYSRSHFLRMFRRTMGITPHQYLLQLRVQQAQRMIKENSSDLVDIALACGFSSHTHMSRIFRQVFSVTPSEYRRAIL